MGRAINPTLRPSEQVKAQIMFNIPASSQGGEAWCGNSAILWFPPPVNACILWFSTKVFANGHGLVGSSQAENVRIGLASVTSIPLGCSIVRTFCKHLLYLIYLLSFMVLSLACIRNLHFWLMSSSPPKRFCGADWLTNSLYYWKIGPCTPGPVTCCQTLAPLFSHSS